LAGLTNRFQAATQADPVWFQQFVAQVPPGQELPYHPKFRLSEAEYRDLLSLLTDSVVMKPTQAGILEILATPSGIRFGPATTFAALRGLELDTVANVVRTTFGVLRGGPPIAPSDAQQATGRWGGPRWSVEAVDTTTITGVVATFAVGRLVATKERMIYFEAKRVADGAITAREDVLLRAAP